MMLTLRRMNSMLSANILPVLSCFMYSWFFSLRLVLSSICILDHWWVQLYVILGFGNSRQSDPCGGLTCVSTCGTGFLTSTIHNRNNKIYNTKLDISVVIFFLNRQSFVNTLHDTERQRRTYCQAKQTTLHMSEIHTKSPAHHVLVKLSTFRFFNVPQLCVHRLITMSIEQFI